MFKYNELSDLLTGELVTPLRMDENDNIICLNKNSEEVIYTFDDFDFDKTPEERIFIVDDTSNEESESGNKETSTPESQTTDPESSDEETTTEPTETEQTPEESEDNNEETSTPIQEEQNPEEPVQKKSGWIEDENEKAELLFALGYNISSLKKINIYRDIVI